MQHTLPWISFETPIYRRLRMVITGRCTFPDETVLEMHIGDLSSNESRSFQNWLFGDYSSGTCCGSQMLPADWFVRGNPTAGAFTITLPVCAGMTGTERLVKNSGTANNLTLAGSGSDLIDGASSITIAPAASVQLMDVLTSTTAAGCHWEQVN
jgi:hypothetical protein